ncbi:MAG TPA: RidA family protein [Planctomycetota bacterium]|nr:RidA family protein [Planctomycetota bacterium]
MSAEKNLKDKNIVLPRAPKPVANYVTSVLAGDLLYLSGHGPAPLEGVKTTGKVGRDVTTEEGYASARRTGLSLLATAREALGSLDRVERVVKLLGMVNSTDDFVDHPKVINGCSDLLVEVFGDKGRGARSAVGMGSLPGNISTEIEAIFLVSPE